MKLDYARYYRKWHDESKDHLAAMIRLYHRVLANHLPADKNGCVLDVGCGMGFALLALQAAGYKNVAGVEVDEGQVLYCQKKGLQVVLAPDTVAYLAEHRHQFSVVLALDVIEHIPVDRQLEFVTALANSLVDEGRLICTVPNANSIAAERWRYNDWTHKNSFTEQGLDFLLYNSGLEDIRVFSMEFIEKPPYPWLPVSGHRLWWAFNFFRLWRRLEMMAELGPDQGRTVPLSLNLLVVTRKPTDNTMPKSSMNDSNRTASMPVIDYSRIYRKWHADTPDHIEEMVDYYASILNPYLPTERDVRILDIGCGMGFALLTLKRLGFSKISGIDCDLSQVESCRAKGLDVALQESTQAFLEGHPGAFDLILALDLLEHIPVEQQLAFTHAIFQSLAPGGKLICTVPNANSILASRYRYICWTHQISFTEHSLDFLLYNGGFQNLEVHGYDTLKRPRFYWLPVSGARHWWAFHFFRLWRRLQMMAELGPVQGRKVPLSLNLMGIARK